MNYADGSEAMNAYRREIVAIRQKMRPAQAQIEPQEVRDDEIKTLRGTVRLAELFGEQADLIMVHNMGTCCPGCTFWADGYNGVHHHVITRAAFVVSSPDPAAVQQKVAASRGWKFPMVSHEGSTFAQDVGDRSDKSAQRPGVSVSRRAADRITRVSNVRWSPGDDFCSVWPFFDRLPEGPAGCSPKLNYP
jgi:predicted dithiol-disulfide oxidoreductase (DUF899 family)